MLGQPSSWHCPPTHGGDRLRQQNNSTRGGTPLHFVYHGRDIWHVMEYTKTSDQVKSIVRKRHGTVDVRHSVTGIYDGLKVARRFKNRNLAQLIGYGKKFCTIAAAE